MPMKLGVYGHGPQSKRYLDPKNWPDGVEVVQLEREQWEKWDVSVPGVIVSNLPKRHPMAAIWSLDRGKAVLCEKPMGLDRNAAEEMFSISRLKKLPLLVAHTRLWDREFLTLDKSPSAVVEWRGPEREDGSCPAMLDWGPHAWSMAIALGTERVATGKGDRSHNFVYSNGKRYMNAHRDCPPGETAMANMLATFASLIDGGYDWRAEPDFALEVHRRCFKPSG